MRNYLDASIEFLLEKACPSIQSRIHREVLGKSRQDAHVSSLQLGIQEDPIVSGLLAAQQPDGWLGKGFHGYDSMEAAVRVLCEKDLHPATPAFGRAIDALKIRTDRFYQGIGKIGDILDEQGSGGIDMIRAVLLAQADQEDDPLVKAQIAKALYALKGVAAGQRMDDFIKPYRGKMIFRQGKYWPSIYHFRLLAYSPGWRSSENLGMVSKALSTLVDWSPLPQVYVFYKGQLIAPASFGTLDLLPELDALDDAGWMIWFQRMELFSKLGVIQGIPKLDAQVSELRKMLEEGGGKFTKPLSHIYFRKWGAYTGLMLEKDWRSAERRTCDLTFRSVLIMQL